MENQDNSLGGLRDAYDRGVSLLRGITVQRGRKSTHRWRERPCFQPGKTLAGTFKFRTRIGMEVTTEALRNYVRSKRRRFDKILDFARVCRVESVMRPYLEAVT
jgi:hypothetical protein